MKNRIGLALVGLRIGAIIYSLATIGLMVFGFLMPREGPLEWLMPVVMWVAAAACLALAIFIEIVIYSLKRRQLWAWVAGLVIACLFIPSIFIVLGILILIGLVSSGTRAEFGMAAAPASPLTPPPLPPM